MVVADAGRDRPPTRGEEILCLPDGRFGFKVVDPATGKRMAAFEYEEVRSAEEAAEDAERRRLYYVAMTRAIDRLIVSGSIDLEKPPESRTPIGWVLERLGGVELPENGDGRDRARAGAAAAPPRRPAYAPRPGGGGRAEPEPDARRASSRSSRSTPREPWPSRRRRFRRSRRFPSRRSTIRAGSRTARSRSSTAARTATTPSASSGCARSTRRVACRAGPGWRRPRSATRCTACSSTSISRAPAIPEGEALADSVRSRYPGTADDELARIGALARGYCESPLAARVAGLAGAASERPFAFEHDGVLLHGRLDVLYLAEAKALVVDYKTNVLDGLAPAEVVEREYRLQRLVYALACFRAGADEVEVVYQFLERPDELVSSTFSRADAPALEAELSAEIARIRAGQFVPTPSEFACAGCPALDVVCAGRPRLRSFAA